MTTRPHRRGSRRGDAFRLSAALSKDRLKRRARPVTRHMMTDFASTSDRGARSSQVASFRVAVVVDGRACPAATAPSAAARGQGQGPPEAVPQGTRSALDAHRGRWHQTRWVPQSTPSASPGRFWRCTYGAVGVGVLRTASRRPGGARRRRTVSIPCHGDHSCWRTTLRGTRDSVGTDVRRSCCQVIFRDGGSRSHSRSDRCGVLPGGPRLRNECGDAGQAGGQRPQRTAAARVGTRPPGGNRAQRARSGEAVRAVAGRRRQRMIREAEPGTIPISASPDRWAAPGRRISSRGEGTTGRRNTRYRPASSTVSASACSSRGG